MEGERPDVSLFVMVILFDPFLELAVLFKAVFLGHRLFLLLGLQDISFTAEVLEFPLEHLVFAELTFQ